MIRYAIVALFVFIYGQVYGAPFYRNNLSPVFYVPLEDDKVIIRDPYYRLIDFKNTKVIEGKAGLESLGFTNDFSSNTLLHVYKLMDLYPKTMTMDEYDLGGEKVNSIQVPLSRWPYYRHQGKYLFVDHHNNSLITVADSQLKVSGRHKFGYREIEGTGNLDSGEVLIISSYGFEIYSLSTGGHAPVVSKQFDFEQDIEAVFSFEDAWGVYSSRAIYKITKEGEVELYAEYGKKSEFDQPPVILPNSNLALADWTNSFVLIGKDKSYRREIEVLGDIYSIFPDNQTDDFYVQDKKILYKFNAQGDMLWQHSVWPNKFLGKLNEDSFLIMNDSDGIIGVGTLQSPFQKKLSYDPGTYGQLAIRPDGNIIVPDQSGITLLDSEGNPRWRHNAYHLFQSKPVVFEDNSFVIVDRADEWHNFSSEGEVLSTLPLKYQSWAIPRVGEWLLKRSRGDLEFYDSKLNLIKKCGANSSYNRIANIFELDESSFALVTYVGAGKDITHQQLLIMDQSCQVSMAMPSPHFSDGWPGTFIFRKLKNGKFFLYNLDGGYLLDSTGKKTSQFFSGLGASLFFIGENLDRIFIKNDQHISVYSDDGVLIKIINIAESDLALINKIYSDSRGTILNFKDGRVRFLDSGFELISEVKWPSRFSRDPVAVDDGYLFLLIDGIVIRGDQGGKVFSQTDLYGLFWEKPGPTKP